MSPAFKTMAGVLCAVIWIAAGREQVQLGQSGWNVFGCFLLAVLFTGMAIQNARKL